MDVNEIYELMLYILSKNKQQGYFSPDDFQDVFNQGQRSYQSWLLGSFQSYTPGRPIARVELGQNSVIRQRLSPSIYGFVLDIDVNGKSPYPGDYIQTDSMYNYPSIYGYHRIRNVQQDQLDANMNSVIDNDPIYLIEDTTFQFYRTTTQQAKMTYVRNAPKVVWGFTLDGNGRAVYDATTSVQPIWDTAAILDIVVRALALSGVSLQFGAVSQYAQQIKREGQ